MAWACEVEALYIRARLFHSNSEIEKTTPLLLVVASVFFCTGEEPVGG
jgi:hypothetical protein